jgi:serine/threonine protein kinase
VKPAEGVSLGNRYRLVSRIAIGGMGEVWIGHDESLARDVAVKVLRDEFTGDEGFLERFRTEARNSAQLSHPNIAQLYDYGEQDGSGFLVMELVLGEPLADLLDREPVLPTRRLLPILVQTARALHAAHVAGVVHRDVKPGNIILSRSGPVKITDFGISTATGRIPMTDSGMVMGTAQYLSPEQAIGRAATPASDIYSLGIVAYEALVGNRPFTGPTAVDIAVAHVNNPVPPMPADVDPALSALVMRMLSKEPEDRPRSAASLARVLDEMMVHTPTGGIPLALGRHARPVDVVDSIESSESSESRKGGFTHFGGGRAVPAEDDPAAQPARRGETKYDEPPTVTPVRRRTDQPGVSGPRTRNPSSEIPVVRPLSGGITLTPPSPRVTPVRGVPIAPTPGRGTPTVGTPGRGTPMSGTPGRGTPAVGTPGRGVPVPSTGTPARGIPAPDAAGTPVDATPSAGTPSRPGTARTSDGGPTGATAGGPPAAPARQGPLDRFAASARINLRSLAHWLGFVASGVNRPLPAAAANENPVGRILWPLVALVLVILFALMGAAFADTLLGPSKATPAPHSAGDQIVIAACSDEEHGRGIIDPGYGMH